MGHETEKSGLSNASRGNRSAIGKQAYLIGLSYRPVLLARLIGPSIRALLCLIGPSIRALLCLIGMS
jgi:hypothetical protein